MKKIILIIATLLAGLFISSCSDDMNAYKDLTSLKGEADKTELYLGESTNLKVIARYTDGTTKDVTSECTFETRGVSEYLSVNGSRVTVIKAEERVERHVGVIFYYKKNVGSIMMTVMPYVE